MPYIGPLRGLGGALKTLRIRRGLSQKAVAEALRTQQSQVSAWEVDPESNVSTGNVDRLLLIYEATLMDLAELLEAKPRSSGGGGGRTLDGEAIRREIDEALRRVGIPSGYGEGPEKKSRRRTNDARASLGIQ